MMPVGKGMKNIWNIWNLAIPKSKTWQSILSAFEKAATGVLSLLSRSRAIHIALHYARPSIRARLRGLEHSPRQNYALFFYMLVLLLLEIDSYSTAFTPWSQPKIFENNDETNKLSKSTMQNIVLSKLCVLKRELVSHVPLHDLFLSPWWNRRAEETCVDQSCASDLYTQQHKTTKHTHTHNHARAYAHTLGWEFVEEKYPLQVLCMILHDIQ